MRSKRRKSVVCVRKESSLAVPHIRILAPSLERGLDMSSSRYRKCVVKSRHLNVFSLFTFYNALFVRMRHVS